MFGKKKSDYQVIGFVDERKHMERIKCDLASRSSNLFGSGNGPYFLSGKSGSCASNMYAGDEVVVLSPGRNEYAKAMLGKYEKVAIVGIANEEALPWERSLLVRKSDGNVVKLDVPFIIVSIQDYRMYWDEVTGWEHWNSETMSPDGRCPVY